MQSATESEALLVSCNCCGLSRLRRNSIQKFIWILDGGSAVSCSCSSRVSLIGVDNVRRVCHPSCSAALHMDAVQQAQLMDAAASVTHLSLNLRSSIRNSVPSYLIYCTFASPLSTLPIPSPLQPLRPPGLHHPVAGVLKRSYLNQAISLHLKKKDTVLRWSPATCSFGHIFLLSFVSFFHRENRTNSSILYNS